MIARSITIAVITALAAAGCAFGEPTNDDGGGPPNLPPPKVTATPDTGPPSVAASVIAKDLEIPWGITFLPDGAALVTERDRRRIVKIGPESNDDGLVVTPVQTLDEVNSAGEGGLLGITASPDYETDKTLFIYYTTKTDNRIASLVLGEKPKPLVTGIPVSGIHNGGRLHFGPDGFLYASTGDASDRGLSQDRNSLGGKILRMTKAGKPAPGNPFPNSLIWTYGHRNVQGFAWDKQGNMYATEFGQNTWDEVNKIEPGKNYGWPTVEGIGKKSGFTDPIQQWKTSEASCSGAAMAGNLLIAACLRGQRLWLMRFTDQGTMIGEPTAALEGEYGRLRAAVVAPDGSVWVSTSNAGRDLAKPGDDKILRIVASGSGGVSKY